MQISDILRDCCYSEGHCFVDAVSFITEAAVCHSKSAAEASKIKVIHYCFESKSML